MDHWEKLVGQIRNGTPTVWFVGSGCSVASGIPTGTDLAKEWASNLFESSGLPGNERDSWYKKELGCAAHGITGAHFSLLASKRFGSDDEKGRFFYDLSVRAKPSIGYAVLSDLLLRFRGKHHVLTTNFDDLVQDALYIFHNQKVLNLSAPEDAYLEMLRPDLPRVIKLHGDHKVLPLVEPNELAKLQQPLADIATRLCASSMLVFVGYGGYDQGVSESLLSIQRRGLPHGTYWLGRHNRTQDSDPLGAWLKSVGARHVAISNFDETMLQIAKRCRLSPLSWTKSIRSRSRELCLMLKNASSQSLRLEKFIEDPISARVDMERLPEHELADMVQTAIDTHPECIRNITDPDAPEDAGRPASITLFGLRLLAKTKPDIVRAHMTRLAITPMEYAPYRHWVTCRLLRMCLVDLAWSTYRLQAGTARPMAETAAWALLVQPPINIESANIARDLIEYEQDLPALDPLISEHFAASKRSALNIISLSQPTSSKRSAAESHS